MLPFLDPPPPAVAPVAFRPAGQFDAVCSGTIRYVSGSQVTTQAWSARFHIDAVRHLQCAGDCAGGWLPLRRSPRGVALIVSTAALVPVQAELDYGSGRLASANSASLELSKLEARCGKAAFMGSSLPPPPPKGG